MPLTIYWSVAISIRVISSPIETPPVVVPFNVMVSEAATVLKEATVAALS
jgi:hypothetical protein